MILRLLTFVSIALCAAHAAAPVPAGPPNVVIFIADDLSWHDVACFGGPTNAQTPHLDRLAHEGLKLTGFYSPASVCSPTRQALLTGLYPVRSGAYPNHAVVRAGVRSLPHHLKPLGYRTAAFGKTHYCPPAAFPFDEKVGMTNTDGAAKAGGGEEGESGFLDFPALDRFIAADSRQPFCAYLATHEPHGPWNQGNPAAYDPAKLTLPPYLVDTPETRQALSAYYAEVSMLDDQVGTVMRALEKAGQADNTLFLFFSEQGSGVPHAKWTLYNPGIRVAAIARWPARIKAGGENPALMQYVDVLPTLIAIAGGDPAKADPGLPDATGNRAFDGRSFLPVLLGQSARHRDHVFAQHTTRGIIQGSEAYASRAVFDGRWKLIANLHADEVFSNVIVNAPILQSWRRRGEQGDTFAAEQAGHYVKRPALELYDLQSDPWELTNVAARPENAATVSALRVRLDAWMKQQGDEGDATERQALDHQAGNRAAGKAKKSKQ
jgi:N-sulfoglucosamine sulfohydrolase